jgi:polyphosphate kinase
MAKKYLNDRDLSWLSFNHRVLEEAAADRVPLLERLKFLAIFSSNLDEFYRVRMPALLALQKVTKRKSGHFTKLINYIHQQQRRFGYILDEVIIPLLKKQNIHFINAEPIPEIIREEVRKIFCNEVAGLLQPVFLKNQPNFFPENNLLYQLVLLEKKRGGIELAVVNIPSKLLPRFFPIAKDDKQYIIFLDDIIREHLDDVFPCARVKSAYNIKITRDADLNLEDDFEKDIAVKIEKKLQSRDFGIGTRLLYEPGIAPRHLKRVLATFHLHKDSAASGGMHHSYKDLFNFPYFDDALRYPLQVPIDIPLQQPTLLEEMALRDLMVHTPYHSYQTVLRYFNEIALDPKVGTIYATFYRIASDSRIAHALISAARNGKKVIVLVELKARFDEANNLRWSKLMKAAGVKIVYSNEQIKVHAKIALAIKKGSKKVYWGLLATGNLNETTAGIYTDHILLTSNTEMLNEVHQLFQFIVRKQKPDATDALIFKHLLVAQFNLHSRFLALIDREISNVKRGISAGITIKLNNIEEATLIKRLYKASAAGVAVQLLVRGICCIKPGVPGLSECITVNRIVDRYLEHGRVFIFENGGNPEVYAGSSDWMIRNIYRRIEVCFPIYDAGIKKQLIEFSRFQLQDNVQAVRIGMNGENIPVEAEGDAVRSQVEIYKYLKK